MSDEETVKINESILTLLDDIKIYLSAVQRHPLDEIYAKIPAALLQTNVNNVKLEFVPPRSLALNCALEDLNTTLKKETLGIFGLSLDEFLNSIKAIQDTNSNITLKEAIEKTITASHKRFSEDQLSLVTLLYTQLYEKVRLLNPTNSKEEIFARLNNRFHNHFKNTSGDDSNKLTSAYYDFINAYQGKKAGFFSIFGNEKDDLAPYNITKKLIENSNSELTAYLNIIHTIKKIPAYLRDQSAASHLTDMLKHQSNLYFSTLLKINSSESTEETKRDARMKAFQDFRANSSRQIENYKENHPEESTRAKIFLNKLLWFITKLIPFVNKEKIMMFRDPEKASSLLLENIDRETTRIAPAA
ncbi:hypothetical protein RVIR1_01330 [Candidatus Rickettsiella viridis]|uniref:Uncharacterized protein n=1 Tax=Candidatus Rickettsiella viridis TaxID=676208 RepID=A0A2Z5UUJ7_9COXI|nr:hypothetical protein [Candidatus Rickettsiella viridis]BBB14671.1 hypothetical protein RVIR1_01330 [Candidatus Rickettsiella viridis]